MIPGGSLRERLWDGLRHGLFPRRCPCCRTVKDGLSAQSPLCGDCRDAWTRALAEPCGKCGKPGMLCRCPPSAAGRDCAADGFYHLVPYRCRPVQTLLFRMKDAPDRDGTAFLAGQMSVLCEAAIRETGGERGTWMLTYPPRTAARRRTAGTDQVRMLAESLSRLTGLPLAETLVHAPSGTVQKALSARERQEQAQKSYMLHEDDLRDESLRGGALRGRRVLLLDDVMTTGATLTACAALLKQAGAEAVVCITAARA